MQKDAHCYIPGHSFWDLGLKNVVQRVFIELN